MVLRTDLSTVKQLGCCRTLVRLKRVRVTHIKKSVGLFPATCHNATRTVVFERASNHHLIIGQQGRGKRVALHTFQLFSVEIKGELRTTVSKTASGL